ncbi:MAG: hypothetical protein EXR27_20700 [Betaproteobacteria bacterium]|nr:hypothetical protein [Betaproteobacteria bacterium]
MTSPPTTSPPTTSPPTTSPPMTSPSMTSPPTPILFDTGRYALAGPRMPDNAMGWARRGAVRHRTRIGTRLLFSNKNRTAGDRNAAAIT